MSRGDVLLGIDLGTTALKAAAFDAASGRVLTGAGLTLPVRVGRQGEREQPTAALDAALSGVLGQLRAKLGTRWRRVIGIGLAAQGGSGLVANRRTGRAHTPLFLWNDARAFPYMARVKRGRPVAFWRRRTMRDGPCWGLGRLLWLRERSPGLFKTGNIYVGAGEYAFFRLTGEWRQDACHALQNGCYSPRKHALDAELLGIAGVPLSFVAPLRRGHETAGLSVAGARLTGLAAGTPVAGPYMDHEAGFLSAAGSSRRPLQCSLGTAWVGNFALPAGARWSSPSQLVLPAVVGEGWLVIQPLLTGNVTWNWALSEFLDRDCERAIAKLPAIFGRELLPPTGLVALPWFNVSNPLSPDALGGGCFFGLNPGTGQHDLLRAAAAAMVCEMFRVFQEAAERRAIDSVVLCGGAARGAFFRKMLAALFAPLPVRYPADGDRAGARGTLHAFSPWAARSAMRPVAVPGRLAGRMQDYFERYMGVFERLYGGFAGWRAVSFSGKERFR